MLDHLEQLLVADDIGTIWDMHCAQMANCGFDRLIYGFTRFSATQNLTSLEDMLILSNHHPDYLQSFLAVGTFSEAPMVKWAVGSVGACSWRVVAERAAAGLLTDAEKKVLELNRRFNVQAGYSIGFADTSARAKGAIGLCAKPGLDQAAVDEIWARHGRDLRVLNTVMHMKMSALPFSTTRRPLTARQREVLEWVGDGKTSADIAQILGLNIATVEKHLRLAREALEVETTAQALLKASMQKQLFITSPSQH